MGADTTGGSGLPASFEQAWGVRERPTKGPKPGLSLEQVVQAGVRVARADGFGAVSMSRVAKEVGTSAMALYRYVASKDELLMLMVDEIVGSVEFTVGDGGWRAELTGWSWAELDVYREHPWVLQVPINGPPVTPKTIAFVEQGLRCLAGTSLTPGDKISAILTLTSFTRAWAMLITQLDIAFTTAEHQTMHDYEQTLIAVTTREEFPALYEVLDVNGFSPSDNNETVADDFVFGLERLLDGFEALMRTRAV
ncbi:TetR/AcrR family transcriptional regulator [Actinophytocola sediminis]